MDSKSLYVNSLKGYLQSTPYQTDYWQSNKEPNAQPLLFRSACFCCFHKVSFGYLPIIFKWIQPLTWWNRGWKGLTSCDLTRHLRPSRCNLSGCEQHEQQPFSKNMEMQYWFTFRKQFSKSLGCCKLLVWIIRENHLYHITSNYIFLKKKSHISFALNASVSII